MKKSILLLFAALATLVVGCQKEEFGGGQEQQEGQDQEQEVLKVEIDGIWYNLVSKTKQAEVTFKGDYYYSYSNEYSSPITIPAIVTYNGVKYSVTSIGESAFSGCTKLLDVYCYAETVPGTGANTFNGSNPEYATLHVPASALNTYKSTAPWSNFGKIVPLTD